MKKILIFALSIICISTCFGCASRQTDTLEAVTGELPKYEREITAAHGELPDEDGIVIDGVIDDVFWKGREYLMGSGENNTSASFTAVFSEKGLYVGGDSFDKKLVYVGKNYIADNTHMTIIIRSPRGDCYFHFDPVNMRPNRVQTNSRSAYKGELDRGNFGALANSEGMSMEMFVTWKALGFTEKPDFVEIKATYCHKTSYYAMNMPVIHLTGDKFIKFGDTGVLR